MSRQAKELDRYQRRAVGVVALLVGLLLAALGGRLLYINTILAPKLTTMLEAQQQSRSVIPARRGTIFDARGRVLAGSRQSYGVFADPARIESMAETVTRVATILGTEPGQIEDHIRHSSVSRFCWLAHRVAPAEAEAIREARISGVGLIDEPVRHYPLAEAMAQVLGFVGHDNEGLEGLEMACDRFLRGRDGSAWTVRDSRRRSIRQSDSARRRGDQPRDGGHVVLTLDAVIQAAVEEHLAEQVERFQADNGVAVAMDPKTGDVLAMASCPTFDPNDYAQYPRQTWRNRAVTDMVEPGSTFKPFVASGALVSKVVRPDETIYCHDGLYVIGGRRLHDASPHGNMTFEQIIARSSNIGMAIIGQRMGNKAIHETVGRFGFGRPTGIDFPGEAVGGVLPLTRWTSYSTTSVPMGHEISVTPLQLIAAFCAIVNDGVLLRPRMIRAFLSPDGRVLEEFEGPDAVRRALPTDVARYFSQQVLVQVVNEGSGRRAALPGYQVLGKTGTAQLPYRDRRGYEPDAYLSSFLGAAPAEDPRVAVLVMIEKPDPQLGYYGSVVAAPAVREILADTLAYLQVPPSSTRGSEDDSRRSAGAPG
ncbi:MAG: peptidoglycan D,D-transpeptidase FtsI family protein [Planctomycetota bacterium]|jgi:cell division protein FtsI (penicillin-binding protein 3)